MTFQIASLSIMDFQDPVQLKNKANFNIKTNINIKNNYNMYKYILVLIIFFGALQLKAQGNAKPPKYTPKKLVEGFLDTIKFKDVNPIKNGQEDGSVTKYLLAETSYYDVSDDKSTSIRGNAKLVVCFKGNLKKGKKDGIFNAYFIKDNAGNDLILNMVQTFKDDKRHGEWKSYDLSGNLINVQNYKNDKIDGLETQYWFNGKKSYERNFKNGSPNGKFIDYSLDGSVIKEVNYKDGELDGVGKQYYPNGSVKEEHWFKRGQFDGPRKYYYENGQLWIEMIYKDNKPWQVVANYDAKGNTRDAGTLKNGSGSVIYYEEDGKIREKINYQNGMEVK